MGANSPIVAAAVASNNKSIRKVKDLDELEKRVSSAKTNKGGQKKRLGNVKAKAMSLISDERKRRSNNLGSSGKLG